MNIINKFNRHLLNIAQRPKQFNPRVPNKQIPQVFAPAAAHIPPLSAHVIKKANPLDKTTNKINNLVGNTLFKKIKNGNQLTNLATAMKDYQTKFKNFDKPNEKLQTLQGKQASLTAQQLMKTTAVALLTLKKGESDYINLGHTKGKVLASKNDEGKIVVAREIKLLGEGAFGQAKLYENITAGGQLLSVAKFAKPHKYAIEDIKNEYKVLRQIHQNKGIQGIQDSPSHFINVISPKGKKELGFMGAKYDGDGNRLIHDQDFRGIRALDAIHQVFSGLQFLKAHQFAHSDIKPDNMLMRKTNGKFTLHLSDFGGAKQLVEGLSFAKFHRGPHTLAYTHQRDRQQEQLLLSVPRSREKEAKKELRNLHSAGDVYSTCASIYEMLTGVHYDPHSRQQWTHQDIFFAQMQGRMLSGGFQRDFLINKNIPAPIISLLEQGLRDNYWERPLPQTFVAHLAPYLNRPA